jgi:HEAT repeat protein
MVQFPKTVDDRALPYLIQALHRKNAPMLSVSQAVWRSSPVWVKNRWAQPLDVAPVRSAAALVIGNLGSNGRPAIPYLIHVLQEDPEPESRACAAYALGQIGYGDTAVSNALTMAAKETNKIVSGTAMLSLSRIGLQTSSQVPFR